MYLNGFSLGKVLRDWINHCFFVTSVFFPGKTRRMAMLPYHFQVKKKCFQAISMRSWLLPIIFPAEYNGKFCPDSVDTSNSVQRPIFLELCLFEWKHCVPGPKHRNINFMLRCCNINLMKCSDLKIMSIVHFQIQISRALLARSRRF